MIPSHSRDYFTFFPRRVEDDLETMWQVASKDNRHMRDTLKKTIRKLQTHEGFNIDEDTDMLLKDPADNLFDIPGADDK